MALSSSPDVITTHDDELEHNSNVFDDNNNYCNDETMNEQLVSSDKDRGYKMAAADSNPPAKEQSLLSANANDEFAVDLSRILNICDDIEVPIYFYIYFNICVCDSDHFPSIPVCLDVYNSLASEHFCCDIYNFHMFRM